MRPWRRGDSIAVQGYTKEAVEWLAAKLRASGVEASCRPRLLAPDGTVETFVLCVVFDKTIVRCC